MNVRIAWLAAAALALAPVVAAPANAETTATVKAQTTQPMSGPNLNPGATAANGYHSTGFNKFDTRTAKHIPGMSYILIP
jgi:hypothetical protein